MSLTINAHEAKTQFPRQLEQAHAGQEIILAKAGNPYAWVMSLALDALAARKPGCLASRLLPDAVFEPLAVEELNAGRGVMMRLLLDTYALRWWWIDDPQLLQRARDAISDPANAVLVSTPTAWGLATKNRTGKLSEADEAVSRSDELVAYEGFPHLQINRYHCLRAGRDPFDRMPAAQTELERLPLITRSIVRAVRGGGALVKGGAGFFVVCTYP